ncbi:tudor domain-containing protein 15 isoform X3 [Artibeus jamaicensis]|uniref:tudor domain-containing protein 15 isoform X3 n=1 Tax=Artibeus jamaicensis TaxID=9417 RepID=UPI00235AE6D2|nr:tudor domain-containing protein 15 isoform X3 [Artibeus jamaicensis]
MTFRICVPVAGQDSTLNHVCERQADKISTCCRKNHDAVTKYLCRGAERTQKTSLQSQGEKASEVESFLGLLSSCMSVLECHLEPFEILRRARPASHCGWQKKRKPHGEVVFPLVNSLNVPRNHGSLAQQSRNKAPTLESNSDAPQATQKALQNCIQHWNYTEPKLCWKYLSGDSHHFKRTHDYWTYLFLSQ